MGEGILDKIAPIDLCMEHCNAPDQDRDLIAAYREEALRHFERFTGFRLCSDDDVFYSEAGRVAIPHMANVSHATIGGKRVPIADGGIVWTRCDGVAVKVHRRPPDSDLILDIRPGLLDYILVKYDNRGGGDATFRPPSGWIQHRPLTF